MRACAPAAQQTFELRAVAVPPTGPRAFVIDSLLSDAEVDHLISIGAPKVSRSLTGTAGQGAFESTTRTSHNTWINRDKSPVVDTIFRRAADVLNISEALLTQRANAEPLQLVHYDPGQRYDAHYDWGVEKKGPTRYITLLLYLNNPCVGGETAFPRAFGNGTKSARDAEGDQTSVEADVAQRSFNSAESRRSSTFVAACAARHAQTARSPRKTWSATPSPSFMWPDASTVAAETFEASGRWLR